MSSIGCATSIIIRVKPRRKRKRGFKAKMAPVVCPLCEGPMVTAPHGRRFCAALTCEGRVF